MVSKGYFEQRFLDGLRIKAQAYSCKTVLIPVWKPDAFQFFKICRHFLQMLLSMDLHFSSLVSPARALDMRSHFSVLSLDHFVLVHFYR